MSETTRFYQTVERLQAMLENMGIAYQYEEESGSFQTGTIGSHILTLKSKSEHITGTFAVKVLAAGAIQITMQRRGGVGLRAKRYDAGPDCAYPWNTIQKTIRLYADIMRDWVDQEEDRETSGQRAKDALVNALTKVGASEKCIDRIEIHKSGTLPISAVFTQGDSNVSCHVDRERNLRFVFHLHPIMGTDDYPKLLTWMERLLDADDE